MTGLSHLLTTVEIDNRPNDNEGPGQMSLSALHWAVFADGSRVLLLGDRGWSSSGPPNLWAVTSVQDIVDTARMVVGPDEPEDGQSYDKEESDHWGSLAAKLNRRGFLADATELQQAPHEVVLSEQVRSRLGLAGQDGSK